MTHKITVNSADDCYYIVQGDITRHKLTKPMPTSQDRTFTIKLYVLNDDKTTYTSHSCHPSTMQINGNLLSYYCSNQNILLPASCTITHFINTPLVNPVNIKGYYNITKRLLVNTSSIVNSIVYSNIIDLYTLLTNIDYIGNMLNDTSQCIINNNNKAYCLGRELYINGKNIIDYTFNELVEIHKSEDFVISDKPLETVIVPIVILYSYNTVGSKLYIEEADTPSVCTDIYKAVKLSHELYNLTEIIITNSDYRKLQQLHAELISLGIPIVTKFN
jgi:hypothetical protein